MGDEPTRSLAPNAVQLVRTATQTNMMLSQMADQKASILMGATFVVFTISIGQVRSDGFSLPLTVLAIFSFLSAMCAVFAVLPAVGGSADADRANILFFGNFTRLSEVEFTERVLTELRDDEALIRAMLRDIYQNGQVLQRKKYRFLSLAYVVFLTGLIATFASFAVTRFL